MSDFQVRLLLSDEEQKRLEKRLLNSENLAAAIKRVEEIFDKFSLILNFSSDVLSKNSTETGDVLMLKLSSHNSKNVFDQNEQEKIFELSQIESLETKLDLIVDRILTLRSEFLAQQFENDLESKSECHLQ